MLKRIVSLAALAVASTIATAQEPVLYYPCSGTIAPISSIDTSIVTNPEAIDVVNSSRRTGLTWNIIYRDVNNTTGVGFDDPTHGASRRATLVEVLNYIDAIFDHGPATIEVDVQNSLMTGSGFLGSAGTFYWGSPPGFQGGFTYDHMTTGTDPAGGTPDITVTMNFGYNWNNGTGPVGPGQYDLYTVLLHEIGHGLGIAGLADAAGVSPIGPDVRSYFSFELQTGNSNWLFGNAGEFLGNSTWLTGGDNGIRFMGAVATAAHSSNPPIYAPGVFAPGSSLSHWDSSAGGGGSVMQPTIPTNTERREFLAFELGALADMGYSLFTSVDDWNLY